MKQRDLVLLPYPFSDLKGTKVRPALIISNDSINKNSKDCIMVPLTSVLKNQTYSLEITQKDLSFGKLIVTSKIRVDKIFNIEKSLIIKKIGTLKLETFMKIKFKIETLF